jgi:hypothetical protein
MAVAVVPGSRVHVGMQYVSHDLSDAHTTLSTAVYEKSSRSNESNNTATSNGVK